MANVDVEIGSRKYAVACKDGEEAHLRRLAAIVDRKAQQAEQAVGTMAEARHLLFASLLLADELVERQGGSAVLEADAEVAEALEQLAARIEKLAEKLEIEPPTS
jgi:cell division protein ZapA